MWCPRFSGIPGIDKCPNTLVSRCLFYLRSPPFDHDLPGSEPRRAAQDQHGCPALVGNQLVLLCGASRSFFFLESSLLTRCGEAFPPFCPVLRDALAGRWLFPCAYFSGSLFLVVVSLPEREAWGFHAGLPVAEACSSLPTLNFVVFIFPSRVVFSSQSVALAHPPLPARLTPSLLGFPLWPRCCPRVAPCPGLSGSMCTRSRHSLFKAACRLLSVHSFVKQTRLDQTRCSPESYVAGFPTSPCLQGEAGRDPGLSPAVGLGERPLPVFSSVRWDRGDPLCVRDGGHEDGLKWMGSGPQRRVCGCHRPLEPVPGWCPACLLEHRKLWGTFCFLGTPLHEDAAAWALQVTPPYREPKAGLWELCQRPPPSDLLTSGLRRQEKGICDPSHKRPGVPATSLSPYLVPPGCSAFVAPRPPPRPSMVGWGVFSPVLSGLSRCLLLAGRGSRLPDPPFTLWHLRLHSDPSHSCGSLPESA